MFNGQRVVVVMPAYNAEKTLLSTYREVIAQEPVDEIVLVDDASDDRTVELGRSLDRVHVKCHDRNRGYGANQKTCYTTALERGADIVIMVHPDYQYTPKLIPAMVGMIGNDLYDCVLASRILGGYAVRGGMPLWRYVGNRVLTLVENLALAAKLSEYHTGYRAFSRQVLESIDLQVNSDDFVFDNQMLAQILWQGFVVAEVSCPTRYFEDASSIDFGGSLRYGLGCLLTAAEFRCARWRLFRSRRFSRETRLIAPPPGVDPDGSAPT